MTDPPYNVAISNSDGKTIENDDMSDGAFRAFLFEAFQNAIEVTKLGGAAYIWMASSEIDACIEAFEKAGWLYKQLLIWVKTHSHSDARTTNGSTKAASTDGSREPVTTSATAAARAPSATTRSQSSR